MGLKKEGAIEKLFIETQEELVWTKTYFEETIQEEKEIRLLLQKKRFQKRAGLCKRRESNKGCSKTSGVENSSEIEYTIKNTNWE